MSDKLIVKEPVFIEDNGKPVAVIVPIETYEAFDHWQRSQQPAETPALPPGFLREKAAFERLFPELMQKYPGKCVAIVGEQVVEVGDDKLELIERVDRRFGNVSRYVQWVTDKPRIYHFPYRTVVRK